MEEPKPRVYVGVKWGMDNPTVMLAAEYTPAPKDHLHIFRELYEESFYFDDLLPIAKAWAQELNIRKFYCDPKEPEFIKRMRRQRLWAVAAPEELGLARNLLGKRLGNLQARHPGRDHHFPGVSQDDSRIYEIPDAGAGPPPAIPGQTPGHGQLRDRRPAFPDPGVGDRSYTKGPVAVIAGQAVSGEVYLRRVPT